jgi:hypothetical protein
MWRNFVQKERNNRKMFSDRIMGYEKVFSLQMREKLTFSRELPEKSTRAHTDFIYGIKSSLVGKTLCKRREIIEIFFPR